MGLAHYVAAAALACACNDHRDGDPPDPPPSFTVLNGNARCIDRIVGEGESAALGKRARFAVMAWAAESATPNLRRDLRTADAIVRGGGAEVTIGEGRGDVADAILVGGWAPMHAGGVRRCALTAYRANQLFRADPWGSRTPSDAQLLVVDVQLVSL